MVERMNINDPYMNRLRRNLLKYERNYNLNLEDRYDSESEDEYKYHPTRIVGGSLQKVSVPPEVQEVIDQLIQKYNADKILYGGSIGKDIVRGVKKGAKYVYDRVVSFNAFKATLKKIIFDNWFIMVMLKVGVTTAITALVASLGGPPTLVAAMPFILAIAQEGLQEYWRVKSAENQKLDLEEEDEEDNSRPSITNQSNQSNNDSVMPYGYGISRWNDMAERAAIHGVNAAREYSQTRKYPSQSLKSLNQDWQDFSNSRLKATGGRIMLRQGPTKRPNPSSLDLRYTLGDVPMRRPYKEKQIPDENAQSHYLTGGAYNQPRQKPKRRQSDRQKRRAELVRRIMQEKGYSLSQASSYIKQKNLKY